MLGFGFSIGLQVMIARRNGECDYGKAGKIFFKVSSFIGIGHLLCLLMQASSPFILGRLISSPEIYRAVIQYLDWRSFGLLFSFPFWLSVLSCGNNMHSGIIVGCCRCSSD